MKRIALLPLLIAASPAPAAPASQPAKPALAPSEIVAAAPKADWVAIAPSDLLVMEIAPDAKGRPRRAIIQLMPPPFSQAWIGNIRTLAAAHWWDGTAITRVQDNYVTQWGDPDGEDPKKAKPLPAGLMTVPEADYVGKIDPGGMKPNQCLPGQGLDCPEFVRTPSLRRIANKDAYAPAIGFWAGWPVAIRDTPGAAFKAKAKGKRVSGHVIDTLAWPVHCYGMVGVGRNLSPDTGTGAELYTVIGHAPRHLDRNIALVGRVIEGMQHLSSLPRGTGALGVYETAQEHVPVISIRLASELPPAEQPRFEYLSTQSRSFADYVHARANRKDAFFNVPAGGADICNLPIPVRRAF